ncbi:MAG: nucleotide exchange factor GrpE [Treponema sp.]|nr:nucleotide exchange factor GrpE [Treponema sp.]MCL2271828.1 nucleotide exchange factor GrpE [Treponema sp.]
MSKKETAQDSEMEAENTAETQNNLENSQDVPGNTPQSGNEAEEQLKEPTAEEKIAKLEAHLAEVRDQLLRKAADFENFRKRMNQEKQSSIEYANQSLLLDIIPVIDDFERAIVAAESSADTAAFLDGIKMIEKRLSSQLETKWGLKRFNSAGELFDPNLHEALMMEKSPDVTEATVQEDFFKGYYLKDRVIRAAKVKVLMPES